MIITQGQVRHEGQRSTFTAFFCPVWPRLEMNISPNVFTPCVLSFFRQSIEQLSQLRGPSLYMVCIQTLGQHKVRSVPFFLVLQSRSSALSSSQVFQSSSGRPKTISSLFSAFVNNPEYDILPRLCLFFHVPSISDPSQFIPVGTKRKGRNYSRNTTNIEQHNSLKAEKLS